MRRWRKGSIGIALVAAAMLLIIPTGAMAKRPATASANQHLTVCHADAIDRHEQITHVVTNQQTGCRIAQQLAQSAPRDGHNKTTYGVLTTAGGDTYEFRMRFTAMADAERVQAFGDGTRQFVGYEIAFPKVALSDYLDPRYERVRPAAITLTGDGSAHFGGRTGDAVLGPRSKDFGRLDWTDYTPTKAVATGVEWARVDGRRSTADEPFRIDATVKLTFYAPYDGAFTKLRIVARHDRSGRATSTVITYPAG